jgi:hypothetical protein
VLNAHVPIEQPSHTKITYLLAIFSADEASKAVAKREAISSSLLLSDKAPWDTMKAQLLAEISKALSPQFLNFDDYNIMFFIPRNLPKPGMALSTEDNYEALLLRAANLTSKTPTVNLTILEKKRQADKENVIAPAEAKAETKSAKKVGFHVQVFSAYISLV